MQQLLGNVGHGNTMGLSFNSFFGIVFGENRLI